MSVYRWMLWELHTVIEYIKLKEKLQLNKQHLTHECMYVWMSQELHREQHKSFEREWECMDECCQSNKQRLSRDICLCVWAYVRLFVHLFVWLYVGLYAALYLRRAPLSFAQAVDMSTRALHAYPACIYHIYILHAYTTYIPYMHAPHAFRHKTQPHHWKSRSWV